MDIDFLKTASLYNFTSHTFTTGGGTGTSGVAHSTFVSAYTSGGASWASNASYFTSGEYTGFQKWTVPQTATYRFVVRGASGGLNRYWQGQGGSSFNQYYGAEITADLTLTQGTQIQMIVGHKGEDAGQHYYIVNNSNEGDNAAAGGGGASWVFYDTSDTNPLFVAGAGAGGSKNSGISTGNASLTTSGNNKQDGAALGGVSGNGGRSNAGGSSYWSAGGAGWLTNGTGGNQSTNYNSSPGNSGANGGKAPRNNGTGGARGTDGTDSGGSGGFGGGGGGYSDNTGTGGGAGYSGGAGSNSSPANGAGGGGGSYSTTSATNVTTVLRNTHGDGSISITIL